MYILYIGKFEFELVYGSELSYVYIPNIHFYLLKCC